MFCSKCGKPIADDSKFCVHCGAKVAVAEVEVESPPETKTEPLKIIPVVSPVIQRSIREAIQREEVKPKAETAKESEPKATDARVTMEAIIEKHSEYYLPEFEKVENGKDTKFKWAAFLFGPMFCIYRKCWELFMKYFLIPYIILGVGLICSAIAGFTFSFAFGIAAMVLSGVFGCWLFVNSIRVGLNFNKDYYEHCKKEMASAAPKCGTSVGAAIGAAAVCAAVIGGVVALTVGVGIFGGSNKIDDFDYDAYYEDFYEEFGDGSSDYPDYGYGDSDYDVYEYVDESAYRPMMDYETVYSRGMGTDAETPRLVIGEIEGEMYGVFYAWSDEQSQPVVICEGKLERYGMNMYGLVDELYGGDIDIFFNDDSLDVEQNGSFGPFGEDYSAMYFS